jgi:excisionase family DNA binding protein
VERLLKVGEVVDRLQVSRSTVYELMARSELASVSIGRSRRIPEAELDRFIREQYRARESAS